MEYLRFGRTDLSVSRLCLGTMSMGNPACKSWVLDEQRSVPILRRALDLGITFFDMADWYCLGRNEEVVGRNLLKFVPRNRLVLATKVYYPMSDDLADRGLSRQHLLASIDRSLTRLGTDHVDLYIIHAFDADTPVAETMETLHEIVKAGKARYLGASTMYACQYNLLYREEEREMMPYCDDEGIVVSAFSPLARGYLGGADSTARTVVDHYRAFYRGDIDREIAQRVRTLAARRGVSAAHIAMAWVASSTRVAAPVIGVSATGQVDAAVEAAALALSAEERAFLEEPYRPRDMTNDCNPVRRPRALTAGPKPS